jgi:hypothetical protein
MMIEKMSCGQLIKLISSRAGGRGRGGVKGDKGEVLPSSTGPERSLIY